MAARTLLWPRRHLLAMSFLSALSLPVLALSLLVPPIATGGGSIHVPSAPPKPPPSSCTLFPTSSTRGKQRSRALVATRALAATNLCSRPSPSDAKLRAMHFPKRLALALLSKITRRAAELRRSVLRSTTILALLLFGATLTVPVQPAGARSSGPSATAAAPDAPAARSSGAAAKCLKIVVTAGAVTAGVLVARSLDGDGGAADEDPGAGTGTAPDESGLLNVVPKAEPSPLPLSADWIEQQLQDAEKETPPPATAPRPPTPRPAPPAAASGGKAPALVTNLDAKIEMLRAREERARAEAEERRLRDAERAQELQRRTQAETDAKIAAAAEEAEAAAERAEAVRAETDAKIAAAAAEEAEAAAERAEAAAVARENSDAEAAAATRDKADAERVERARRDREQEKEAERERQLGALERGKTEQVRLERQQRAVGGAGRQDGGEAKPADVAQVRRQPKPAEEERKLQERYGNMDDVGERAYNILVDLGMVEVHSDPDAASSPASWDEDDEESKNVFM